MAQCRARTIEGLRLRQRYIDNRIDELEELAIRRLLVKIVGLVANRVTPTALHPMIVVVEHFLERAAINHGLIALETFALFALERLDRDGTKLDSLHGPPRLRVAFQDLDSVKPGVLESCEKTFFGERAGNATAPKLRIVLQLLRALLRR